MLQCERRGYPSKHTVPRARDCLGLGDCTSHTKLPPQLLTAQTEYPGTQLGVIQTEGHEGEKSEAWMPPPDIGRRPQILG